MGRHRKPSVNFKKKLALGATVGIGAAVVPATFASPASAATAAEWDAIAQCESTGRWNLPYGDADSTGGLQIQDRTWADYGGTAIAQHAYQASKQQQIAIAEKILAGQGAGAWACKGIGLSSTPYDGGTPATPPPAPTPTPTPTPVPAPVGDTYTVVKGDSLSKIAAALKVEGGWQKLYELNKAVIGSNPNLIYPGQKLKLPTVTPAPDPYKDGLPQFQKSTPSAKPLQAELQRVGYLSKAVKQADNYGGYTATAVAVFHDENTQFRTKALHTPDVQIGPKGWAFLRGMASGSAKYTVPLDIDADSDAPATGSGSGTPTPPATPPATGSGYVKPLSGYSVGDGLIIGSGGSMSRSAGGHSGLDLIAPQGTKVVSVASGLVVSMNASGSAYGNHVVVKHADGKYTLYAHLSATSVSVGQSVTAGQQIGNVGSTGNSNGPHLHFEVRTDPTAFSSGIFLDPRVYLASHGVSL